ncbi:O-acetylhomoserine (thiol)-lyase [Termitomyces sp. J132]|nr:O-acetylhomoserine (thiol)-lyase [Termitomyces sp. J132]
MDNPTVDVFEKRVTCLEDGIAAIASASGLVAQFMALSCLANSGDNIVCDFFVHQLKSSSSVMASQRSSHREHSPEAVDPLYCESTGNPRYNVPDIPALAALAHRHSIPLVVDNTFGACGTIAGPLDLGADIAVELATKVCGHGTVIGGVIVDGGRFSWGASTKFSGFTTLIEGDGGWVGTNLTFWDICASSSFKISFTRITLDCTNMNYNVSEISQTSIVGSSTRYHGPTFPPPKRWKSVSRTQCLRPGADAKYSRYQYELP